MPPARATALSLCLLAVGAALAGCAAPQERPTAVATSAAGSIKVAILLPGPINDSSWSQAGYQGLALIERDLGAEVAYTAGVTEESAQAAFGGYAEAGFDLVIGHGAQFYTAAEAAAEGFPRTKFAVVGNFPGNNRNLGAVNFRNGETGYLVGVVAALKSKIGRIAYIGGVENSSHTDAIRALEQGIKDTNPAAELAVLWVDSWTDQERATALAQEALGAGADVLIQNADIAGLAVLRAADEAGVYAIGWAQDQHALAPEVVLTSAIQRVPVLIREAAALVQRGRWEGKLYRFGMREGALDLAPFYGALTAEEEARVAAAREAILTEKIIVDR